MRRRGGIPAVHGREEVNIPPMPGRMPLISSAATTEEYAMPTAGWSPVNVSGRRGSAPVSTAGVDVDMDAFRRKGAGPVADERTSGGVHARRSDRTGTTGRAGTRCRQKEGPTAKVRLAASATAARRVQTAQVDGDPSDQADARHD